MFQSNMQLFQNSLHCTLIWTMVWISSPAKLYILCNEFVWVQTKSDTSILVLHIVTCTFKLINPCKYGKSLSLQKHSSCSLRVRVRCIIDITCLREKLPCKLYYKFSNPSRSPFALRGMRRPSRSTRPRSSRPFFPRPLHVHCTLVTVIHGGKVREQPRRRPYTLARQAVARVRGELDGYAQHVLDLETRKKKKSQGGGFHNSTPPARGNVSPFL